MVCDHPTWQEVKSVCLGVDEYIMLELGQQYSSNRARFGRLLYRNHLPSTRAECRTYASRLIRARRTMQWSALHEMLEQEYARANIFQQANPSDDTFASAGITFMHTHINTTLNSNVDYNLVQVQYLSMAYTLHFHFWMHPT